MRKLVLALAVVLSTSWILAGQAGARPPSGAIFTTVVDGTEVNLNQYAAKEDVYLDGGPGIGAPATAAGLDDGRYVFQVTDPSGKQLLSMDRAACRRFDVSGGLITGVVATGGCEHAMGTDVDHGAKTVQLIPYLDTPNMGGVYKVWITTEANFLAGCSAVGTSNGLSVVDCGQKQKGNAHGFVPSNSKTDNYKVKNENPREIDTRFYPDRNHNGVQDGDEAFIDGLSARWTDPLGASNIKWSYYAPDKLVYHEAHVEALEDGTHTISVFNQSGCTVGSVTVAGQKLGRSGAQDVSVTMKSTSPVTTWVDVACV